MRERADRRSPRRAERPPAGPPTLPKHATLRPRAREPKTRRFRGSADGRDSEGARAGASATRTRASRGERTNGTHHLDEVPCEPRERASQRERGVRRRGRFSSENYFFIRRSVDISWWCTGSLASTALDRRSSPRRRGPRRARDPRDFRARIVTRVGDVSSASLERGVVHGGREVHRARRAPVLFSSTSPGAVRG